MLRFGVVVGTLAAVAVAAGDPAFYTRQKTWQQTMLASREALAKIEQARLASLKEPAAKDDRGFSPVVSKGMTSRSKNGRRIRVRVRGLDVVWLGVASASDDKALVGCWGDAVLVSRDKKTTPLHTLEPVVSRGDVQIMAAATATAGKRQRRAKGPRIGKQQLSKGLMVKPGAELCFRLGGKYEMLEATVGVAAAKDRNAPMDFHVSSVPLSETLQRERDRATLLALIRRDFPTAGIEIGREENARVWERDWTPGDLRTVANRYAGQLRSGPDAKQAGTLAKAAKSPADVQALADLFHKHQGYLEAVALAKRVNLPALRRAIGHLTATFGDAYPNGAGFLKRIAALEKQDPGKVATELVALQREALLANPLLDFDRLLLVKRHAKGPKMGLPQNWQGNCALPRKGYDDEITVMSPVRPGGALKTLFKPARDLMVADVDLHWDGRKLLFSSVDDKGKWQVFEMNVDPSTGSGQVARPRQVTKGPLTETDNYDAIYLPDERIIFASAAVMTGVPCVGGKTPVSNLYIMDRDGGNVRQLCFDQDHNWTPAVMNDGRVLYTRWEYTDAAHYFTRLLFRMNPDGTQQMAHYGSNSYWPNSTYYARPIPGHPSKVVGVISGHHGVPRMGELIVFDPAVGSHEADGVVQRIPGYGKKVEPLIRDGLVNGSWPKFLHPWPLSENYFLTACQPDRSSRWGIYLVDIWDNMVLIADMPNYALLEPVPLRARTRPPVIMDKVDPRRKDALVYLTDIYAGAGLRDVPRDTVKKLRVFEWHYAYQRVGGHQSVTQEGGWDIKRILGTVAVEGDGSALFRVPANTPLAVQPLDEKGRAVQIMRSWFVAMPGEVLSCVGCHERPHLGTANHHTAAIQRPSREIEPWRGATRGFSFKREVQPVLDKHCVGCHDGSTSLTAGGKARPDGKKLPNFAETKPGWSGYTSSYLALHPYVRRPGPESDYHMFRPGEYLANTSELIQKLEKGHHGVELDAEAWDRLVTWIDLNVPDFGTWGEKYGQDRMKGQQELRAKFRKLYAGIDENPEAIPKAASKPVAFVKPKAVKRPAPAKIACAGWPFDAAKAKQRQAAAGPKTTRSIDLGSGVKLTLALIPAGEFVMGSDRGALDEAPRARVRIDQPFWMATTEITNLQYRAFDPGHDSRYIDQHWKDHTGPGYPANRPTQPVIRVAWRDAVAFSRWLSEKTGEPFALPTEAQWEYACRAGSDKAFAFGDLGADYGKFANLGDVNLRKMAVRGVNPKPLANPSANDAYLPMDAQVNDGQMIVADVAKYQPNAWGLHDMHGNVAEWTLSTFKPYPYRADDGRNEATLKGLKVARGGSWRDRAQRGRAAYRLGYSSWQPVFNVGFRVIAPATGRKVAAR